MVKKNLSSLIFMFVLLIMFVISFLVSNSLSYSHSSNSFLPFIGFNIQAVKEAVNIIKEEALDVVREDDGVLGGVKSPSPGKIKDKFETNPTPMSSGGGGSSNKESGLERYFFAEYVDSEGFSYDDEMGAGPCNQDGPCYGNDESDVAYCPDENYCVYDGDCYIGDGTEILDIDGDNKHEAVCIGYGWWDLDTGLPGMQVCEDFDYHWVQATGTDVGEYQWNYNGFGCCGDDEGEYYWESDELCHNSEEIFKFLQITDPHIIEGGTAFPHLPTDGRTDPYGYLVNYVNECSTGSCTWIDPIEDVSVAPTIAFQDVVNYALDFNYDFAIITGDLISNGLCDENTLDSFVTFKGIADGLGTLGDDYYVIGANVHDSLTNPDCLLLYENIFGEDMINWYFTKGDNLFVGLSEVNTGGEGSRYDDDFLINVLDTYQNQNMKLFLFTHIGHHCYDEHFGGNVRCPTDEIDAILHNDYKDKYKVIIVISGHNHANIYEEYNGIHYFTTTATMNYPAEFRIFDVGPDYVDVSMSGTANEDVDGISLEIMLECANPGNPLTYYGEGTDREIFIDLS